MPTVYTTPEHWMPVAWTAPGNMVLLCTEFLWTLSAYCAHGFVNTKLHSPCYIMISIHREGSWGSKRSEDERRLAPLPWRPEAVDPLFLVTQRVLQSSAAWAPGRFCLDSGSWGPLRLSQGRKKEKSMQLLSPAFRHGLLWDPWGVVSLLKEGSHVVSDFSWVHILILSQFHKQLRFQAHVSTCV